MKLKNHSFLKNKLKDISFSTLKLYNFEKVEKNTRSGVYSIIKRS